jgi:hypothetical protein
LIIHRFPKLQRLLDLPSSKGDNTSSSKTYSSSTRRTYNSLSFNANNSLKLKPIIGEGCADVEISFNDSQERIMHAGIQVTTDVSVNDKSV